MITISNGRGAYFTGKTVNSIVRREYGKDARITNPAVINADVIKATVIGPYNGKGNGYPILGTIVYHADDPLGDAK